MKWRARSPRPTFCLRQSLLGNPYFRPPKTMNDFLELAKSIGTPAGMLAAIIYFLSRAGKFLGPMIEKLFTAHVAMVESLKTTNETTQPLIQSQHGMITDIHEVVVPANRAAPPPRSTT